jgi:hypothetical protein
LKAPLDRVRADVLGWRRGDLQQVVEASEPSAFPDCMALFDPLESPWSMEMLIDSGEWTTYMNNGIGGGDPTAAAPHLAVRLGCDGVVAMHAPLSRFGRASTQLVLIEPTWTTPSRQLRVLAAHAEDGRWSWHAHGAVQGFETPARYTARRIRDRFDRALLVTYLAAMGIRVDDPSFFGNGIRLRRVVDYEVRREPLALARANYSRDRAAEHIEL